MGVLKFINNFSLDVALGAMVSSLFFAKLFNVDLSGPSLAVLGLVVWLIYTFDHLEDAKTIQSKAITLRHRKHQEYYKILAALLILGLLLSAIMVFFIPKTTLIWGASLFCLVAAYFVCLHFLNVGVKNYKEVIIAILYTAGVLLPVLSIYDKPLTIQELLVICEFALLAFTNLLVFSLLESDSDKRQKLPSFIQSFGEKKARHLLYFLFVAHTIILASLLYVELPNYVILLLAVMMVILYAILLFAKKGKANLLYRIAGDGVFILPGFIL